MRVLILGGTGAMGKHLVHLLSQDNIAVVVTSRDYRPSNGTVHYMQGNAQNEEFLQKVLIEKWDVIIDFMVYTSAQFSKRIKFLLAATSQYVFLSSARVYAESESPITELSSRLLDTCKDREFLASDEYALAKAIQENILINSKDRNWTIIRPYITYSEERLQLGVLEKESWLYRALNGRTIVFSKDINVKLTTLTYGTDVARGIRSLIGNDNALGEVFHICEQKTIMWKAVLFVYLDVLEEHLGYRPKVLLEDLTSFKACHFAQYQIIYDRLYDREFNSKKIAQYVDLNNFIEVKIGLRKCLKEFLKNPKFKNINWKLEAFKDRRSGERALLSEIPGVVKKIKYLIFRYFLYQRSK